MCSTRFGLCATMSTDAVLAVAGLLRVGVSWFAALSAREGRLPEVNNVGDRSDFQPERFSDALR